MFQPDRHTVAAVVGQKDAEVDKLRTDVPSAGLRPFEKTVRVLDFDDGRLALADHFDAIAFTAIVRIGGRHILTFNRKGVVLRQQNFAKVAVAHYPIKHAGERGRIVG